MFRIDVNVADGDVATGYFCALRRGPDRAVAGAFCGGPFIVNQCWLGVTPVSRSWTKSMPLPLPRLRPWSSTIYCRRVSRRHKVGILIKPGRNEIPYRQMCALLSFHFHIPFPERLDPPI